MPNSSRRGYHPSAERWFNVIWVTNETAPPMSDQTMSALMITDSEAAAIRTHLIVFSRRCRDRLPLKPVILADEADSRTSIAIALPAVPRETEGDRPSLRAGPVCRWRRRFCSAPFPGAPALGEDVRGEIHVPNRVIDRGDRAFGEIEVDEGGDCRVAFGLGLVHVDEERPRERIGVVGDRLRRRGDALAGRLGDLEELDLVEVLLGVGV